MTVIRLFPLLLLAACGAKGEVNLSTPQHNVMTVGRTTHYECGTPPAYEPFIRMKVLFSPGMTKDGKPAIAMTGDQYRNLGKNMARLEKAVLQLEAQRDFYRDCIDRSKAEATQ